MSVSEESGARNGIGISGHSIFLHNLGNGADVGCCLAAGASACSACIPGTFSGATGQYSNPPFAACIAFVYLMGAFRGSVKALLSAVWHKVFVLRIHGREEHSRLTNTKI